MIKVNSYELKAAYVDNKFIKNVYVDSTQIVKTEYVKRNCLKTDFTTVNQNYVEYNDTKFVLGTQSCILKNKNIISKIKGNINGFNHNNTLKTSSFSFEMGGLGAMVIKEPAGAYATKITATYFSAETEESFIIQGDATGDFEMYYDFTTNKYVLTFLGRSYMYGNFLRFPKSPFGFGGIADETKNITLSNVTIDTTCGYKE